MKKITFLYLFIQFATLLSSSAAHIQHIEVVQVPKYENLSEHALVVPVNYAGDIILSDKEFEILLDHELVKIELVYTQFRRNIHFNQEELNANRIEKLQNQFPFINFDPIKWNLVEQTQAQTYEEAQKCFHGFVFHFKPKMSDDESIMMFDAFMDMEVKLPTEIDYAVFNKKCVQQFSRLAQKTGGDVTVVAKTSEVTKSIVNIIDESATEGLDVMIILDKTSSMADDFINIKKGLHQIISSLENIKDVRLAISSFGDKNVDGRKWYDFKNFEGDFTHARNFLNSIQQTFGGDYPESVYDGVYETFKEDFWRSNSKRVAILLGDAPSLVGIGTTYTEKDIVEAATADEIHMNFYPILLSPYNTIGNAVSNMQPKSLVAEIYPNPTNGPVTLKLENPEGLSVQIFDQSGKMIHEEAIDSEEYNYNLQDLKNGLYLFRVLDEKKNFDVQRVVLNK
ncbi:MAG: hypothetical protein CMP61_12585 [Flavobacteriales bacterium]|nr:hypothetical protein [Flavobacteriales bacterium]|tara:strand:- start:2338 stop:3696 length:1359 start_codon:yes stop_codon:yes gene_type:complete